MPNLLISWVGQADLRAPRESPSAGVGPIAQALTARSYDAAVLIADYPKKEVAPFLEWLRSRSEAAVTVCYEPLPGGPTHFGQIHEAAVRVVSEVMRCPVTVLVLNPVRPAVTSYSPIARAWIR